MLIPSRDIIISALQHKGYKYLNDGKLYHLNIVGIRSASPIPNTFDDLICVSYNDEKGSQFIHMDCTTKPGLFYLDHPDNKNGVAILCEGQYENLYTKGKHKGAYDCLVQCGTLKVYRDNKRNGTFDYSHIFDAPVGCGLEIHHAGNTFKSIQVDNWSAGCTVIADPKDFERFMELVNKSIDIRGNKFTYTVLKETDLVALPPQSVIADVARHPENSKEILSHANA